MPQPDPTKSYVSLARKILDLAHTFHTLAKRTPASVRALMDIAEDESNATSVRQAAAFVLSVAGSEVALCPFNFRRAWPSWDDSQRSAWKAWAADPWLV